jgi:hypothetical protein
MKTNIRILYIEYLNKDKNFTLDRIYFESFEDAKNWGKDNLDNFNLDMIRYERTKNISR